MSDFDPWRNLEADAMVWAEAFCALYPAAPDTGTMVGWFANAIEIGRSQPAPTPPDALREALAQIREITRPFSMTMSGPQWMSGDTDIFRGGNREKVWRIADAALAATEGE